MTISSEVIGWSVGALSAFLSFCVHLLIRINANLNKLTTSCAVNDTSTAAKLEALNRHQQKNEQELAWMRRHASHTTGNLPGLRTHGEPS